MNNKKSQVEKKEKRNHRRKLLLRLYQNSGYRCVVRWGTHPRGGGGHRHFRPVTPPLYRIAAWRGYFKATFGTGLVCAAVQQGKTMK